MRRADWTACRCRVLEILRCHRGIVAVALLAAALRLALLTAGPMWDVERAMGGDSPRYVELADNLARHATFGLTSDEVGPMHRPVAQLRAQRGETLPRDARGLRPETMRTPGYPFYLALFHRMGLAVTWALVGQCMLAAVTVAMTYAIALRLLDSTRAALAAALILALHPADILAASSLLTETLFTALLVAGLLITLHWQKRHLGGVAGGGLFIGLSALVRPVSYLLGPAIAMWMLATDRRWRSVAAAAVVVASSLVPVFAWSSRNATLGVGFGLCQFEPIQNFTKTAAYMRMARDGKTEYPRDWVASLDVLFDELRADIRGDETVFAAMNRLARNEVRTQPALYLQVLGGSAVKFMLDHSAPPMFETLGRPYRPTGLRDALLHGNATALSRDQWLGLALATLWTALNVALAALMLAGFVRLALLRRWDVVLLLGGVLFYFIFASQSVGLERMRVPVIGLQAIVAAALFLPRRSVIATIEDGETPAGDGRTVPLDTPRRRAA